MWLFMKSYHLFSFRTKSTNGRKCSNFLCLSSPLERDLEILLKLKSTMVEATRGLRVLEDWVHSLSPSAHCSFSGVSCDNDSRVIALNVSYLPLFGSIPPEVGLLKKLVNLTLASNNLTGILPVEMANLTSIKLLDISNNNLTGHFPGNIFDGMTQLEILNAYNNDFMGLLPMEVVQLKRLKHLEMGGNYFSGEIPSIYSEIQSLEYLSLRGNGLTGRVPASLAKLMNLQELYLGYFNAYEGGIPPEFGFLRLLRVLDMGNCSLSGEIPASLGNLEKLEHLFLQINRLSGHIPAELSGLVSLKFLDLSINELTGELPGSFSRLNNLMLINLFQNHLQGRIPSFVGDISNLEILQVWENNFTFELPKNLGSNGKLVWLDVSSNRLSGAIPQDLCKSRRLEGLILMINFFHGSIPEVLGDCKSLVRLRMKKNLLSGTIPPAIFNLPLVEILELNDNCFTGELPSKTSGDKLSFLTVSNNLINGRIPPAIGNLTKLQTLSLEMNRFSGEIPKEIFDLKTLIRINISVNNISGEIPTAIFHCSSLGSIDFSRNNLHGKIPKGIAQLEILNTLNLSKNQFSGHVPIDEIKSMTSLTTLDLSHNNFSGTIPNTGQFLVFNESSFTGNPDLLYLHNPSSSLMSNPAQASGKKWQTTKWRNFSYQFIIIILLVTAVLLVLTLTVYNIIRKLLISKTWKLTAFQRLSFSARDVVECLKEENIIATDVAGTTYHGCMPNGVHVVIKHMVKQCSRRSNINDLIHALGTVRHRNIVKFFGYMLNEHSSLLLYEYIPNGSLGELLHGPMGVHLQWESRRRIAMEVAQGLSYLHHDCSTPITHDNLTSNSIWLDSDFNAHLADFGLTMFTLAGSHGCVMPEVDEKSNVYSFGVVLLELITGQKPVGGEVGDEGMDIVKWVQRATSEASGPYAASAGALVDPRLSGYPLPGVISVLRIAMMCVEEESSARPTMREVLHMLTASP
ncbi:receptor protein kinase CLAVATA1-like [Malania oleifera]|uniref:receptor protein kinase CLAVATA1-like n=1 Tax=Malania oleifera TaxID=397392 RepID=UPI0025ADC3DE|nr:receptor protein kinase CLAVATA1-like [Malania oleifera]